MESDCHGMCRKGIGVYRWGGEGAGGLVEEVGVDGEGGTCRDCRSGRGRMWNVCVGVWVCGYFGAAKG